MNISQESVTFKFANRIKCTYDVGNDRVVYGIKNNGIQEKCIDLANICADMGQLEDHTVDNLQHCADHMKQKEYKVNYNSPEQCFNLTGPYDDNTIYASCHGD